MKNFNLKKAVKVSNTKHIVSKSTSYTGDCHEVLDQVQRLNRQGQLTFHINPEGVVGAMTFTETTTIEHTTKIKLPVEGSTPNLKLLDSEQ